MRKDGRGHWDHDEDPRPILSTVFGIIAPFALAAFIWWCWAEAKGPERRPMK